MLPLNLSLEKNPHKHESLDIGVCMLSISRKKNVVAQLIIWHAKQHCQ